MIRIRARHTTDGERDNMFSVLKSNLARRILLLVGTSILLMLVAFILSGWLAITQTSEQVKQQRQTIALTISQHLDQPVRIPK